MANQDFRVKNGLQVGLGASVVGIVTAESFSGSAVGLTNVPSASLTGTISSERLSGTYDIDILGTVSGATISATTATVTEQLNVGAGNTGVFATATDGTLLVTGIATFKDRVIFDSTNSIQVPVGTEAEKDAVGTAVTGQIRYNTTNSQFEGFGPGNDWGSLGGVKDVDGDTYVKPESSPGSDEDALTFFTGGTERAVIDSNGKVGIGSTQPTSTLDLDGTLNVSGVSTFRGNVSIAGTERKLYFDAETNPFSLHNRPKIEIATPTPNRYYEFYALDDTNVQYVRHLAADLDYNISVSNDRTFLVSGGSAFSKVLGTPGVNDSDIAFKIIPESSTELRYNKTKKFETTGYGVSVTGGLDVSGISTFQGNVGINTSAGNSYLNFPIGNNIATADIIHAGTGIGDYTLYTLKSSNQHYIRQYTSGYYNVSVGSTNAFVISNTDSFNSATDNPAGVENADISFVVNPESSTELRYNYNKKLETTGYGVSVYGGLDVSGISTFNKISVGNTTGTNYQYLRSTGDGLAWDTFPVVRTGFSTIATAGQTGFSTSYNVGFIDVYVNGIRLTDSEFTANDGTNIGLSTACFGGEYVDIIAYSTISTGSGGGGVGGGSLTIQDEGTPLTSVASILNFVGAGVTATGSGATKTITINGGGGGSSSSYTNSDVDNHINVSTASSSQVLSWNGSDYDWVDQSAGGGGGGISLTDLSVTTNSAGSAALSYNDSNGVFSYTPPDLSSYLTAESDTLATVTGRGSSTNTDLTFGGKLNVTGVSTFSDDVNIGTGATVAFFDISSGNVGISSTQPTAKLDVDGTLNVSGISTLQYGLEIGGSFSGSDGISIKAPGSGTRQVLKLFGGGATDGKVVIQGHGPNHNNLVANALGTTELWWAGNTDAAKKLETTGYGVSVYGDARISGILTVGQSSVTIDGTTNEVVVGTGVTIQGNTGIVSATEVAANSLQFSKNNATLAGTSGTTGQFKQIGGAPFYYDGTAWREFALLEGTPVTTPGDTDWDNVMIRLDFDNDNTGTYSSLTNLKDNVTVVPDGGNDLTIDFVSSPGMTNFGKAARFSSGHFGIYWDQDRNGTGTILYDFENTWTIEFWMYLADLPTNAYQDAKYSIPLVCQQYYAGVSGSDEWIFGLMYNDGAAVPGTTGHSYSFYWYNENHTDTAAGEPGNITQPFVLRNTAGTNLLNTWVHVALVKKQSNSEIEFYLNGSATFSNSVIDTHITNAGSSFDHISIGYYHGDGGNTDKREFIGSIDDFRVSTNERYTTNFTPPTSPYPTTGTTSTVYTPPNSKEGEITLGASPTWTGTTGVTASQVASGHYRLTFSSAYSSTTAYSVNANMMDYDPATSIVGVGVSRVNNQNCDFYVRRLSDDSAVDTGSLAVSVYKK